ncbi:hypothetical protein AGLY_002050, partial [Aphis glycines]
LRYGRYLVDRTDAVPVRYLTVSRPVCIITLIPLLAIAANTIVSYLIAITTSYWCRIIVKIIIGILSCVIILRLRIVISISTCNLCDIATTIASDMIRSAANITSGIVLLSPIIIILTVIIITRIVVTIIIIATETDFVYSDRGYNFAYNQSFSRLDCFPDSYLTNDFRYYFYFRPDFHLSSNWVPGGPPPPPPPSPPRPTTHPRYRHPYHHSLPSHVYLSYSVFSVDELPTTPVTIDEVAIMMEEFLENEIRNLMVEGWLPQPFDQNRLFIISDDEEMSTDEDLSDDEMSETFSPVISTDDDEDL